MSGNFQGEICKNIVGVRGTKATEKVAKRQNRVVGRK